jgi:hypothetical protein
MGSCLNAVVAVNSGIGAMREKNRNPSGKERRRQAQRLGEQGGRTLRAGNSSPMLGWIRWLASDRIWDTCTRQAGNQAGRQAG